MKKQLTGLVVIAAFIGSACEDFLTKAPIDKITIENFYETEDDIKAAVIGSYNALLAIKNSKEHVFGENRSDNTTYPNTNNINVTSQAFYPHIMMVQPTNTFVQSYWSRSYHLIARINEIMDNMQVVQSHNGQLQYEAESLFLRSWSYFNLVRYFGDVPLILKPVKTGKESAEISRTSKDQVYSQIVSDLQKSLANMEALGSSYAPKYGQVNKWAVAATLAKVYMTLGQNDKALPLLEDVYTKSGYKLTSNYEDLFVESLEDSKGAEEIIFPIRFEGGGLGLSNSFSTDCANQYQNTFGNAYVFYSNSLKNAYKTTSDTAIDRRYAVVCGDVLSQTVSALGYPVRYIPKMVGLEKSGATYRSVQLTKKDDSGLDFPQLRFADVILMLAEVKGQTEGLPLINEIRTRAKAPLLTAQDIIEKFGGDFQKAVLNERRLELAGENDRYFDMLRMGDEYMIEILTDFFKNEPAFNPAYVQTYNLVQDVLRTGKVEKWRFLLPIPFNDVLRSSALIQNPGYSN